jgi:hypothetical protein
MVTGGGLGYAYGITNIEYTEFKRLGIRDEAQCEGSHLSVFPANTNVLYLGLKVHRIALHTVDQTCSNIAKALWMRSTSAAMLGADAPELAKPLLVSRRQRRRRCGRGQRATAALRCRG